MRRTTEGLQRENDALLRLMQPPEGCRNLILNLPSFRGSIDRLTTLAKVDATVLITGKTGTGKGVLARTLHAWSARRNRPFVKCDCAALPPTLVESELFGHEKGAFTGAHSRRIGRFEMAHGGTIFLDELGEIPLETQAKLLGVLEDRQFQRVGGTETISVDIRIIAATNRDLRAEIAAGRFREDLFYRLNVLTVHLPPLRDRPDDIPPLAEHFVGVYNRSLGRNVTSISPSAMAALTGYAWPGNVRELQNVIERAMLLTESSTLTIGRDGLVPDPITSPAVPRRPSSHLTLAEVETRHILEVLRDTRWCVSGPRGAARILGLHPNTLRSLMERLGIDRERIALERQRATAEP
jgi:formate hydrogenlyase transcriptional activator